MLALQVLRQDFFVELGSANRGDLSDRRLDNERAEHNDFLILVCLTIICWAFSAVPEEQ